ncbi:dolichyl-phosphate beta-glucosyltransferase [Plakobranchus ocellatus]|uniref:Dolichyl-phosphate beta-glucosyltransferase n=1 Tax=Plakobranchus ocellatus TaxID=259542 RepID=A0AAV3ZT09_9GAST|nr:dolichyl-phosphate beta-glucosyltransferase [Plakobranchus ocellatus]
MIPLLTEALTFIVSVAVVVISLFLFYAYKSTSSYPELKRHDSEKFYFDTGTKTKRRFPDYLDKPTLDLSVVVPAYNEEARLPVMMAETMEYLEKRQTNDPSFTYEIIIVDDGSKDNTTEIGLRQSEKYGSDKVRVLTLHKNKGKGGAVRMGVLSSRGRNILFVDADGASKFSDLDKLEGSLSILLAVERSDDKKYKKLLKHHGTLAVVCGSRAHLEKESIAQLASISGARSPIRHPGTRWVGVGRPER